MLTTCAFGVFLFVVSAHRSDAPYPPSPVIADMVLDWSTHRREALGSDNWQLTWADDDHQYGAWGDSGGFGGTNSNGRVGLGFGRIEGGAIPADKPVYASYRYAKQRLDSVVLAADGKLAVRKGELIAAP